MKLPEYDLWQALTKETRPILLYGMGNGADKILATLAEYGIEAADVFASDGFVRGHTFHGKRVLSFSEAKDTKTVTIINIKAKGEMDLTLLPLTPKRDLVELKGTYNELTLKSYYEDTTYPEDYVHITLTDEEDIPDVLTKLRVIYKNIMKLDYNNLRTRHSAEISVVEDVTSKTPLEHFADFYEAQNGQPMSEEQVHFMTEIIEQIWRKES